MDLNYSSRQHLDDKIRSDLSGNLQLKRRIMREKRAVGLDAAEPLFSRLLSPYRTSTVAFNIIGLNGKIDFTVFTSRQYA